MRRFAWLVVLAACKQQSDERPPLKPPVEELDRVPAPAAAPRQPTPPIDQIIECFGEALRTPVPESMSSVTIGDFDNDGKNDVAVSYETLQSERFTGHVAIYRNAGDARLVEHSSVTAGDMVYAVSAGDIDGDGNLDLAVGDPHGKRTRLYAGKGDGTFVEKPAVSAGRAVFGATLVDLDGDHRLDLVDELFSDVAIYKGDGAFGFRKRMTIDTGQAPDGPVVADLDGDGVLDLGYAANDEGYLFTLKGPAYKQSLKQPTCGEPAYTSGGDFDDDGDTDIAFVCDDKIDLRLNDGKGGFSSVTFPYGPAEEPIVAADLTGDGKTDLLVSHRERVDDPWNLYSRIAILEGDGKGWHERTNGRTPIINGMKVADMDGDKRNDIVLATWTGNQAAIYVLLGHACP